MGRAEGLEGDAGAIAELSVRLAGIGEDRICIDAGGAAYFESGPVPFV